MGLCKKKKSLSDEDFEKEFGRHWIWASIDPESKLIINFFVGQRTLEDCRIFIGDLIGRICTKPLFTSDELPHYQTVLLEHYSHLEEQPRTGKRGRPMQPKIVADAELKYATVHKTRLNGKVVKVERNVIFGDPKDIEKIIEESPVSKSIMATKNRRGDMLAEVAGRAAAGRVGYLELMITPEGGSISRLAAGTGWDDDFDRMRANLLARGMQDILAAVKSEMDRAESVMQPAVEMRRGTVRSGVRRYCPLSVSGAARGLPREVVFAQILAGCELADR